MTTPTRGKGRPSMLPEERQVTISLRLPPADAEKFKRLGGKDWLSQKLRKAPTPKEATQ